MPAATLREELQEALDARQFVRLRAALADREPADVAEAIEELEEPNLAVVFRVLQRDLAAAVFEYLEPETQVGLIKALGREQVAGILDDMSPDDRTQLLEELPAAVTRQVLALLSPEERKIARELLGYPEDSIGRLMTPAFVAVGPDWTVQQSLDYIREHGDDSETLNVIYVVDQGGRLIDDLRIRQLLLRRPDEPISELTDGQFISLKATDDQETAVQVFMEYDRVAFPVTDSRGVLLGIVTVDDVLDVATEEATEDIHKLGGSEALEQPYMQIGFLALLRKRAGWLVVLFVGQLLTLNAMEHFSAAITRLAVIVFFVPLIISAGGNCGSQAATLVIRAMALEQVRLADWWRVLGREILFGMTVGVVLSTLGVLRIVAGHSYGAEYGDQWSALAIAVGLSLVCVVLWGLMIGSMLPFVLRGLGVDPAASSTPLITTLVDVSGLFLYFTIATSVLA